MRLSEAIRLGSLAIQPRKYRCIGDGEGCANGAALLAVGAWPNAQSFLSNWDGAALLLNVWPWTRRTDKPYPNNVFNAIADMFDNGVIDGTLTIEQLCDQVRAWEDELESRGINVEQVTMAAELNQPASPIQSIRESVLEQDVAK